MMRCGLRSLAVSAMVGVVALQAAQGQAIVGENTDYKSSLNKHDREEWFRDLGFLQKPGTETKAARDGAAFQSNQTLPGRTEDSLRPRKIR